MSTSALPTLRQALRQLPHAVGTAGPQLVFFARVWPIQLEGSVLYTAHKEFKENGLVCTGRGEMHFPRPEVRIYSRRQRQPNRKARNGAEAQTQTNTQQLPPVKEGTLEVPSQQNKKNLHRYCQCANGNKHIGN